MTPQRQTLRIILDAALNAVAPDKAVLRHVTLKDNTLTISGQQYQLDTIDNIYLIGAGKGAAPMAATLETMLGDRLTGGTVCVKYEHICPTERVILREAAHPVPDAAGEAAAHEMLKIAQSAKENDLVLCVITGGASALTPALVDDITLAETQQATQSLLECGATIHEINAIRKHISMFGGGNLARAAAPAQIAALIISDVVGDDLDVIASGPTSPDPSTYQDCVDILAKYGITDAIPAPIRERIMAGAKGDIAETPKADDPAFARVQNVLVATNEQALQAAGKAAEEHGYAPRVLTSTMTGEAREQAGKLVKLAQDVCKDPSRTIPVCLLAGGETTVTLTGNGLGGRNQEMALAASMHLEQQESIAMLCAGTDGTDGPTDAAGGFACVETVRHICDRSIDPECYLDNNDAYHFLEATGSLVKTGPTLTNVMDLVIMLVECPA